MDQENDKNHLQVREFQLELRQENQQSGLRNLLFLEERKNSFSVGYVLYNIMLVDGKISKKMILCK
ncbi:MAG: hypothetical protein K6E76_03440 [Patescibacteria group bacterium]|nr:hypothetical protein [Patescibacteria group bacterium]